MSFQDLCHFSTFVPQSFVFRTFVALGGLSLQDVCRCTFNFVYLCILRYNYSTLLCPLFRFQFFFVFIFRHSILTHLFTLSSTFTLSLSFTFYLSSNLSLLLFIFYSISASCSFYISLDLFYLSQRKEQKYLETEAAQKNESLSREDFLKFEWIVVGPRGNKRIVKVPRDRAKARKRTQSRPQRTGATAKGPGQT